MGSLVEQQHHVLASSGYHSHWPLLTLPFSHSMVSASLRIRGEGGLRQRGDASPITQELQSSGASPPPHTGDRTHFLLEAAQAAPPAAHASQHCVDIAHDPSFEAGPGEEGAPGKEIGCPRAGGLSSSSHVSGRWCLLLAPAPCRTGLPVIAAPLSPLFILGVDGVTIVIVHWDQERSYLGRSRGDPARRGRWRHRLGRKVVTIRGARGSDVKKGNFSLTE